MEDDIYVVDVSVGFIYQVIEVDSESLSLVFDEDRVIFSYVFLDRLYDVVLFRFGGVVVEKFDVVELNVEDVVELFIFVSGFEFEDDFGEFEGRVVRGESVVGEDWRFVVGVGEFVVEDVVRVWWWWRIGEDGRFFDFEVGSR